MPTVQNTLPDTDQREAVVRAIDARLMDLAELHAKGIRGPIGPDEDLETEQALLKEARERLT